MRLVGPASLTVNSIDGAVVDPSEGSLEIDLSQTTFIEPAGLVVLAVLLDMATTRGWPTSFVAPMHRDPETYLSRMGLGDLLQNAGCPNPLRSVRARPADQRFVELQRFDSAIPADDLIDLIDERLRGWGDDYLASTLYNSMLELGLNVEEHAEEPGFVAAQWYPRAGRVSLAVGDFGIGIRRSLARHGHSFQSPSQAIIQAATTRLSAKGANRGAGLPFIVDTFTRTNRSYVTIVSGGEAVTFQSGKEPQVTGLNYPTPGTFLFAGLPWR